MPSFQLLCAAIVFCGALGFAPMQLPPLRTGFARITTIQPTSTPHSSSSTSTALNVWWFGGSEPSQEAEISESGDSCELVAVRIERTSPNSRNIRGEITVDAPLKDVWAILTDYDQLATHVPNLVESKTLSTPVPRVGQAGDGQYKCRLFQRGAQKIIGFEFGASVTMDMTEKILAGGNDVMQHDASTEEEAPYVPQARQIGFKCVESPFFTEFDGTWKVQERLNEAGKIESVVSYAVEVRPKGPVPVAALEWRIREDVPTNLRAVKHAALTVGYDGVMAERRLHNPSTRSKSSRSLPSRRSGPRNGVARPQPVSAKGPMVTARLASSPFADWGEDETMAAYLEKDS